MSQARTDRYVVGGLRSTAAGRAHALRARGFNDVEARRRAVQVLKLRRLGLTFAAIAGVVGVSRSQCHRDYWGLLLPKAGAATSWK